jgi:dihydroxyacid dehydratase/phosphogluconate dehydratase
MGHVGPEALAGGPIGRLRDGDRIRIRIDCRNLEGSLNLVGDAEGLWESGRAEHELNSRTPHPGLSPHEKLPADTRLWAALVRASGGTWGGCVYDVDSIVAALERPS